MGATVYRYALSIFIIRIFLRFVKRQTGVFSVLPSWQYSAGCAIIISRVHWNGYIFCIRRSNPAPGREWLQWLGWSFSLCAMSFATSFWSCKTAINGNNRPSVQLGGYFITILVGADRFRCALSIFIIRIFLRFVKRQTGVFFGFAVLTKFDRICYNKALGHTENGGRFRFLLPRIYIRWEVMLWNIMWLGQNSLRFWHSWLHLQLCCIIFSMTIIKRNNRPSCNCGGYFF